MVATGATDLVFFIATSDNEVLVGDGDCIIAPAFRMDAPIHTLLYDEHTCTHVFRLHAESRRTLLF